MDTWIRLVVAIAGFVGATLAVWLHLEVGSPVLTLFVALLALFFLLVAAFASARVVEAVCDFFGNFF